MHASPGPLPRVATAADLAAHDGQRVEAAGVYRAIPMPKKGVALADGPKSHAFLELAGGERVYLEAFGVAKATRPAQELRRFDGRHVTVEGIAHSIMPSPGAGLVAACLSDVASVADAVDGA